MKLYVVTDSGEILNQRALIDAIDNAINRGNYYNAGFTGGVGIVSSLTDDPTSGNIDEGGSSGGSIAIAIVAICVVGLILSLALILAMVVARQ